MLLATVTLSRPAGPFPDSFALQLGGAGAGEHIRYVLAAPSPLGAASPMGKVIVDLIKAVKKT